MSALAAPNIRHEEVTNVVWWQMPHGRERMAMADSVAIIEGCELIALRLVRVRLGEASIGRAHALLFEQPVTEWAVAAAENVRGYLVVHLAEGGAQ